MTLQGILFDLDGTLADTLPVCIQAYQATVEHFCGRFPEESEIYALFGPNDEGMLEQLAPGRLVETLPYFLEAYERFHSQCTEPFPGVKHALDRLQAKGMRMAIVSGKGRYSADISMRILGLDRWLDIVETGFAEKADKPRSMRTVLERWGIEPWQAAYVGDTPADMQQACQAGVLPLGAAWMGTSLLRKESQTQAEIIFYDLDSFLRWIELN